MNFDKEDFRLFYERDYGLWDRVFHKNDNQVYSQIYGQIYNKVWWQITFQVRNGIINEFQQRRF